MSRYVALFRGANVGKAKRIAMAELRVELEALGFSDVCTLLNSGNAVFTAKAAPPAKLAAKIRAAVLKRLGVDAHVIVKSADDVAAIVKGNALAKIAQDASRLLVAMSDDVADLAAARLHMRADFAPDRVHVGKHAAYVWCATGILESKALSLVLKSLGAGVTTRNWATLGKIEALMADER